MTKIEQINQIFENPEIQQQVSAMTDPEEIRQLLAENGAELTSEEMDELLMIVGEKVAELMPDGELSEDDLDDVAGGLFKTAVVISLGKGTTVLAGVLGGIAGVAVVGALAYGGYCLYKKAKKRK